MQFRRLPPELLFALLFFVQSIPASSKGGILELLSQGAAGLSGNVCAEFKEDNAGRVLRQIDRECKEGRVLGIHKVEHFSAILNEIEDDTEDNYFALIANQHIRELKCAQSFAASAALRDKSIIKDISEKMEMLRQTKMLLSQASTALRNSTEISNKTCPAGLHELKNEFTPDSSSSEYVTLCQTIIQARLAYQAILESIPLSSVTPLHRHLERYASSQDAKLDETTLRTALKESAIHLEQEHKKIGTILSTEGGAGFDRHARNTLLADPAVVQRVLQAGHNDKDLQGLACRADARYGSGADQLNKGLMITSLVASAGAGAIAKLGVLGSRMISGASIGRSTGLISLRAMRTLQVTALGVDSLAAYSSIDASCGSKISSLASSKNSCVLAPTIRELQQDNCILATSLSALGFAAILGPSFKSLVVDDSGNFTVSSSLRTSVSVGTSKSDVTTLGQRSSDFHSDIIKLRTSGKTAQAQAVEAKINKILAQGKIVGPIKPMNKGVTGALHVPLEEGVEGVWKPSLGRYANGNAEVAASVVDQHLGTGLVPLTVERKLEGVKGTIQLKVNNLKAMNKGQDLQAYPDHLRMFDYLIGNSDRHSSNYLFTAEGKTVAIDHGLAFKPPMASYRDDVNMAIVQKESILKEKKQIEASLQRIETNAASFYEKSNRKRMEQRLGVLKQQDAQISSELNMLTMDKAVIEKLRNTTKKDWQRLLDDRLSAQQIDGLYERQQNILRAIDKAEFRIGQDIYPAGVYSPLVIVPKPIK